MVQYYLFSTISMKSLGKSTCCYDEQAVDLCFLPMRGALDRQADIVQDVLTYQLMNTWNLILPMVQVVMPQ